MWQCSNLTFLSVKDVIVLTFSLRQKTPNTQNCPDTRQKVPWLIKQGSLKKVRSKSSQEANRIIWPLAAVFKSQKSTVICHTGQWQYTGKKAKIKGSHTGQLISPDHEFQDTNRFLGCEQESGAVSHCDQGQKDRVVEEQTDSRRKARPYSMVSWSLESKSLTKEVKCQAGWPRQPVKEKDGTMPTKIRTRRQSKEEETKPELSCG